MKTFFNNKNFPLPITLKKNSICAAGSSKFVLDDDEAGSPQIIKLLNLGWIKEIKTKEAEKSKQFYIDVNIKKPEKQLEYVKKVKNKIEEKTESEPVSNIKIEVSIEDHENNIDDNKEMVDNNIEDLDKENVTDDDELIFDIDDDLDTEQDTSDDIEDSNEEEKLISDDY